MKGQLTSDDRGTGLAQGYSQTQLAMIFIPLAGCILSLAILILKPLWKRSQEFFAIEQDGRVTDNTNINGTIEETIFPSDSHMLNDEGRDVETSSFTSWSDSTQPIWALQLQSLTLPTLIAEFFCDSAQVVLYVIIIFRTGRSSVLQASVAVACRGFATVLCLVTLLRIWTRRQVSTELWLLRPFVYGLFLLEGTFECIGVHPEWGRLDIFRLRVADLALVLLSFVLSINVPRRGRPSPHLAETGAGPSPESHATVLSVLCFGWMNPFIWQGSGQSYDLSSLYYFSRETRAFAILQAYRQHGYGIGLVHNLIHFARSYLLLQACWAILSSALTFAPVLLFQEILGYVEQPTESRVREVWIYVLLLLLLGVGKSLADGQAAWMGTKIYIRARGVLAGEIFSKALQRSLVDSSEPKVSENTDSKTNPSSQSASSNGQVMNLLSSDTQNIAEMGNSFYLLWVVVPIELTIGMILLYNILGYSAYIGLAVMVALTPANIFLAGRMSGIQKGVMALQSSRISRVEELLLSIRTIKFQAWEDIFKINVNRARENELNCRKRAFVVQSMMVAVYNTTPLLISIVSFTCYTLIAQKELRASIAFPALSLFALIRSPLDKFADVLSKVIQAKVSAGRVDDYLQLPDKSSNSSSLLMSSADGSVSLKDRCFTWSSHKDQEQFRLQISKVDLQKNKLNLIVGPTASGKSAFLLALLGEMYPQAHKDHVSQSFASWNRPENYDQSTQIAYCAQDAWLVNDTIKQNILFGSNFNSDRYKEVLSCCSLEKDLAILAHGDLTIVGEKGIMLSGGQKQRVSLARAMYSDAKILLLDDCLSAVDAETAQWIFKEAIKGPLNANRTCIMVTHNVDLCIENSDHVVVLEDGKVITQGPPSLMNKEESLIETLKASKSHDNGDREDEDSTESISRVKSHADESATIRNPNDVAVESPQDSEHRNVGAIKFDVFRFYFSRMGSWPFWISMVTVLLVNQFSDIASSLWVRQWANAYQQATSPLRSYLLNGLYAHVFLKTKQSDILSVGDTHSINVRYYLWVYALLIFLVFLVKIVRMQVLFHGLISASRKIHSQLLNAITGTQLSFFDKTPYGRILNRLTQDMKVIDMELALVMLGLQHAVLSALTIWIIIVAVTPLFIVPGLLVMLCYFYLARSFLRSSWELKRLEAIQYSPIFQYLGETLSGFVTIRAYGQQERFMRNFAQAVDEHTRAYIHLWAANTWLTLRVEALSSLVATFSAAFIVFNAKNLDPGAAGLSLTYGVTFTGHVLWFVRCYSMTQQNMNSVERVEEYVSLPQEEPKTFKEEITPSLNDGTWPPQGRIAFSNFWLKYADHLPFVLKNIQLVIQPGQKVAIVGRTGAGKSSLSLALLRAVKASSGSIFIDDVDISTVSLKKLRSSISYIPQDPTIFSGSLRTNLDPLGEYTDEELLRVLQKVTFIKADTLAQGSSILSTLVTDSSGNSSDETTSTGSSNDKTKIQNTSNHTIEDTNESEGESLNSASKRTITLSSGQRQLICLARALLKRPKILIMDEATASIDYETDTQIQKVLREDLGRDDANQLLGMRLADSGKDSSNNSGTTVITIAHRIRTIIDYDRVVVLDKGEVVENDEPWNLLRDGEDHDEQQHHSDNTDDTESTPSRPGIFSSMCRQTGQFEELKSLAKVAWESRRNEDQMS